MPTYEYRCSDCGESLEARQSFTDDPLTECPACGGALKKQFGNVGIAFKGSGFYRNDSRGSGKSASTAASSSSSSSTSTSDSSSSAGADSGAGTNGNSGSNGASTSTSSTADSSS